MESAVTAFYDKAKADHGGFATYTWIGSGLYLFLADGGLRSLFTLKSIAFFVIGMFVAAIIFGGIAYLLRRTLARGFSRLLSPSPATVVLLTILGFVLTAVDVVLVYVSARLVYGLI